MRVGNICIAWICNLLGSILAIVTTLLYPRACAAATRYAGNGQRDMILVWNYEQGLLVSFDKTPGVSLQKQICLSDAALMMALFENEHVYLYRTCILTLLGSVHVPQAKGSIRGLHFISQDCEILLEFVHPKGSPLIGSGLVLDAATLSIVKRISVTGTRSISPLEMSIDCDRKSIPVYYQLTSSVSAILLSVSIHLKLTAVPGMCDSLCPQSSQARFLRKEVHSESGLHFTMTKDSNRITVVASDDSGQHKQMAPYSAYSGCLDECAFGRAQIRIWMVHLNDKASIRLIHKLVGSFD